MSETEDRISQLPGQTPDQFFAMKTALIALQGEDPFADENLQNLLLLANMGSIPERSLRISREQLEESLVSTYGEQGVFKLLVKLQHIGE